MNHPPEDQTYDVAVLGAGAAGLAAAVFAALDGARTILIERTGHIGGTSALSAGTTWVPMTRLTATVDGEDSPENALAYLDKAVGNRAPRALRQAFLDAGPEAIHRLMDRTVTQFRAYPKHPDYLAELEGSTSAGRAIEPVPFDGKALGRDLDLIRPPIPEFTILGGLMVDRKDIGHLLAMGKSATSLWYGIRLIGRYAGDRLRFGRSTRLVMGNALIGRLLKSARDLGVEILTDARVTDITPENGAHRLTIRRGGDGEIALRVKGGVILASGGFTRHAARRKALLPEPLAEYSPAAPGHTGELHDIVEKLGAVYGEGAAQNAFWAPNSRRKRKDGGMAVFPHFVFDRSKPGVIAVGRDGRRFTNEARSYHEFALAQYETGNIPAHLIADAATLRKFGLGMIRPGGWGRKAALADGYLVEGATIGDLAVRLAIDPAALEATVAEVNRFADSGVDPDFHRGETVYERHNGDPRHRPNPTLGRLEVAPFYALRLYPGEIGAAAGLAIDADARLLDRAGRPIAGLYACGADAQSIMGGVYPGPGITIGPGIVFGYLAARHATGRGRS